MKPKLKAYLFAFAASLVLAASFIFSKAALNETDMYLFGFIWFGIGAFLLAGGLLSLVGIIIITLKGRQRSV